MRKPLITKNRSTPDHPIRVQSSETAVCLPRTRSMATARRASSVLLRSLLFKGWLFKALLLKGWGAEVEESLRAGFTRSKTGVFSPACSLSLSLSLIFIFLVLALLLLVVFLLIGDHDQWYCVRVSRE